MSRLTGTVKVRPTGDRGCYRVESWTTPMNPHSVDLYARGGFGECTCQHSQIAVWVFIKAGGDWKDKRSRCRHTAAARLYEDERRYKAEAAKETEQ